MGAHLLAETTRQGYEYVRDQSPQVSEDRRLAPDISRLAEDIRNGSLRAASEPGIHIALTAGVSGGSTAS